MKLSFQFSFSVSFDPKAICALTHRLSTGQANTSAADCFFKINYPQCGSESRRSKDNRNEPFRRISPGTGRGPRTSMASRRGERGRNYVTAGTPTLVVRLLVFAIVTAFRAFAFMSRLQRLETHRTTGTGRLDVHCQKKKKNT